jgi:Flp pilus assembly protein TadD
MGLWTTDTSSTSGPFDALALQETIRNNVANTALSSGITLYSQKKYTQAAQAFKQASALNPALAQAYTYLGYADTQLGKKDDAVKAFKLSLKVDKTQDKVYSDLANLYIDMKKPTDAEKTLQDAIKQNNLNTPAYYTLGQLMAQRKDYTDAETQFRKVIKLEPKDGNGYYALGMALNGQGKPKDAIAALKTAISLKKDFVPALTELGKAYAAQGDTVNAQKQVDQLNKIGTSAAHLAVQDLQATILKPGISFINPSNSALPTALPTMTFAFLDATKLTTPGTSKDFSMKIVFNTDMDSESVQNIANWSISKASGGRAGVYNNGLYSVTDVAIPAIPKSVIYDPINREARLTFTLRQHSTTLTADTAYRRDVYVNGSIVKAGTTITAGSVVVDGTIDPSHLVFKFLGKDQNGKAMDESADQIDGASGTAF